MHRAARPLSALFLLATLLPAQAPASPIEDLLPASSYACIRFGGLDAAARGADQLAAAQLLQAVLQKLPEGMARQQWQAQFDQGAAMLRDHLQQVGLEPAALRQLLARPMALGVGRLTIAGMGPSVALLIDCREGRERVHEVAKAVLAMLRAHLQGVQSEPVTVAGVPLHRLWREQGDSPEFLAGDLGDCYLLSNSRGYVAEIAAVMAGKQPSLAHASTLEQARAQLPQPALASLYVNSGPALAAFAPHLPYEAEGLGDALGVRNLDGVYAGAALGDHGGAELLQFGLSGNAHGALKAAFSGSAGFDAAKWCSADTVAFAAASLDLPAAVEACRHLFDSVPLAGVARARQQLSRHLDRALQRLGMSGPQLEQLLRAFGHRLAFAVDLPKGPLPIPEALLFVEVGDFAQVEPLLQQLQQASARQGIEWKTRQAGDAVVHCCELRLGNYALTPGWVHQDGMLVLGSHVPALLRALERHRVAQASLFAEPDFAAAMQQCAGAGAFAHLRGFRAAELGWRTVETWSRLLDAQSEQLGFGSEVLPDQDTVAAALGTCTLAARVDAHGLQLQSRGNFGFACLLAGLGRAADEVLARASGRVF